MSSNLLNDLNKPQQEAIRHTDGPILILAGAGSGKTRVLTYKVAYLITDKKVSPQSILMMTFTNKAANQMKERIKKLISGGMLPFAGTFHSLCAKILRTHGSHIGIPLHFSIYDDQDQIDTVKDVLKNLDISPKQYSPNAILSLISQAKNELISATEYPNYARGHFQETVARVYLEYQKKLFENGGLDFDDLLMKTVQLFDRNPTILNTYQERFVYILVDEYQDTNKAQYILTKMLCGRHGNICVVGDASQSIYRWRGADFRNIINFKHDFPHTAEFHLEQNYRSTQIILDAAQMVIAKNTTHPILKLWTDKKTGERITLYEARTEQDEASFIIQVILQSEKPFEDFAILYRTNAQSRVLEEALLHAGVPYVLVGGTRFYERKEIKDILAYLRLLANPKDLVSYRRAEKLGKARLSRFLEFSHNMKTDVKLIGLTTLELLDHVRSVTKYEELYDPKVEEEAYRLENVKELRSVATQFPNLVEFLENVALMEEPKAHQSTKGVTLMTLHSAKGLEFSTVFIVGMEEGIFPHARSLMERDELEEERRLCYVGITRAKDKLYLTYANRRLFFGTRTQNMISRFIADIEQSMLDLQVSLDSSRGFKDEDFLL